MSNSGKTKERAHDAKLVTGTQTHLANAGPLTINGEQLTAAQIVGRIDARIATLDDITKARGQLKDAVQTERLERPPFKLFETALESVVRGMFGNSPAILADFDLAPRKAAKVKVATKAQASLLAKATREARHTMSKKAKKGIKGTAPAPQPGPAPEPPTPEPAPAGNAGGSAQPSKQ